MLRLMQTKRRHKKIVKQKDKTNEEDTNDMSSTGHEGGDGQRSNTHKDQDRDVSFENDVQEEIDTTEVERDLLPAPSPCRAFHLVRRRLAMFS